MNCKKVRHTFSIVLNSISAGYWLPPSTEKQPSREHTLKNTSSDKELLVVVLLGVRRRRGVL